ncbi:MAG: hypothetical protein U1F45_14535 [Burkholderiales bacterium]
MIGRYAAPAALLGALVAVPAAHAQLPTPRLDPRLERRVTLDELLLDTVRIETQLQAWTLRKICLAGQAYWVGFGEATPPALRPPTATASPRPASRGRGSACTVTRAGGS